MNDHPEGRRGTMSTSERLSYRPPELAAMTGFTAAHIRNLARTGIIPTLPNCGAAWAIPAWAVRAWEATGDWRHPDYHPSAVAKAAEA